MKKINRKLYIGPVNHYFQNHEEITTINFDTELGVAF